MRTEWNPRFFSTKNFHIDPDPQGMKSRDYTTNGGWDPKNRTDTWFITVRCSFSSPKTWGFGTPDPNGRTLWLINGGVILATYYNLDDSPRTPPQRNGQGLSEWLCYKQCGKFIILYWVSDVSVHAMVKINCWKMKFLLLMQAPLILRDELAVLFQGKVCNNIINIQCWSTYPHVRYPHEK